jgi:hypothetical protein
MTSLRIFFLACASLPSMCLATEWNLKGKIVFDNSRSPELQFELTYRGVADVTVYGSDLPWGIKDSLTIVALSIEHQPKIFEPLAYVDDPGTKEVIIKRGQTLRGTVSLRRRLAQAEIDKTTTPIGVCWAYEFRRLVKSSPLTFSECAVLAAPKSEKR